MLIRLSCKTSDVETDAQIKEMNIATSTENFHAVFTKIEFTYKASLSN